MENNNSSLRNAILEAKEIENASMESAKKMIEETITNKIDKIMAETIKEIENGKINEDVKINVGGSEIEVKTNEDGTSVEIKTENPEVKEVDVEDLESTEEPKEEESEEEEEIEIPDDLESEEEIEEEPETEESEEEDEEEIFEVIDEEIESVQKEVSSDESLEEKMNDISGKLDIIIGKIGAEEAEDKESEGEVEIVDDQEAPVEEKPAEEVTAQQEVPTEEKPAEEIPAEEKEETITEDDMIDIDLEEEPEELEEIEIVDEDAEELELTDDEEEVDEMKMLGQSNSVQRTSGTSAGPAVAVQNRSRKGLKNENKNIEVQNESGLDELKKENESLKKTIKEYKESFVILRKQINEVQIFNAKLAYANKLFSNGGLTHDDKIQIAEEFDKVETIEEAKKLYNTLLKEGKFSTEKVNENVDKKIKSVKPITSSNNSDSKVIYESDETRRMKKLAGIK